MGNAEWQMLAGAGRERNGGFRAFSGKKLTHSLPSSSAANYPTWSLVGSDAEPESRHYALIGVSWIAPIAAAPIGSACCPDADMTEAHLPFILKPPCPGKGN